MNRFLQLAEEIEAYKRHRGGRRVNALSARAFSVPQPSVAIRKQRVDKYLQLTNHAYTLTNGSKVKAYPAFAYGADVDADYLSRFKRKFEKRVGNSRYQALKLPFVFALYGRAKPSQVKTITQALIDAGEPVSPLDKGGIRALQHRFGIGIDCAGYVQLAFVYTIYGDDTDTKARRKDLGLKERRGAERLYHLPASYYQKIPVTQAQSGDLMVLHPRPPHPDRKPDPSIHTVLVYDRTQSGDVHTFWFDASWGNDAYGNAYGGVGRRKFLFNEQTATWEDIHPGTGEKSRPSKIGPYKSHPVKGLYRIK